MNDSDLLMPASGTVIGDGTVLQLYSSDGQPKGYVKVAKWQDAYTINVRKLRWYERAWLWIKRMITRLGEGRRT